MRGFFIFLLGFIFGAATLFFVIVAASQVQNDGITMFETPGERIDLKHDKVMVLQVYDDGSALAHDFTTVVRLVKREDVHYYDNQIVEAPYGYCWRQVGTYKYTSKSGDYKTVPIVNMFKK